MEQEEAQELIGEIRTLNKHAEKISKSLEKISDEIKSENNNTSKNTMKSKIVDALEKITKAIEGVIKK